MAVKKETKKVVFVENTANYASTFTVISEELADDGTGTKRKKTIPLFNKTFPIKRLNTVTGAVEHTGFTMLTQDELDKLKETSKAFRQDVESGALVVHAEAPQEALLDSELIDSLKEENDKLKAEIAELKELLINAAPKIDEQAKELEKLRADFKALTAEYEAYKTAKAEEEAGASL